MVKNHMKTETEMKFRSELRSFFGLIMLNLVAAAMGMGLGIALSVTILTERFQAGDFLVPSLFLIPLGVIAMACGVFWITRTAELMGDITDLREAYHELPDNAGDEQVTALMIEMVAVYRANRAQLERMTLLGTISGVAFMLAGSVQFINELWVISNTTFVIDNIDHLIGGCVTLAVGAAGILTAHYFSIYSKLWDARLAETERIEEALREKLEGI